ncbi:vWA domain-containing protein [Flavobacterium salmonis]|uniref:VWFA domain-containing protein n=1 Tax=Flavobacterium salmonis TaxID=2654844 RepID=A0A6V6Z279_9FLAO|nr:vWA domain-containing protein [Flavobacterium salmonis]CAD0005669.1 hypothetical protein FLAT13_02890 [Flavobacterium salmonis]
MSTSNPVVAIPIVDTSGSMTSYNYVALTVIDTKAFLSNALPGDYIGVASYDTNGRVTYPLTIVDQALTVPTAAANAVQNLSFNGNSTNIGGGLQTAVNMLSAAPAGINKGFVLLTDGYQNAGTYPIPLPAGTPPVYACAMGPNSDQNLLRQIATQSNGVFYYAPYVYDMMTIYNQIRSQTPGAQLLANGYKNATAYDFLLIPATVSVGNDLGQFSVVWTDPSYLFTNGQPGANQLSVTLVTPAGVTITPMPSVQGGGYVTFNIDSPASGLWYIQIMYGGAQPIGLTGGAFEYSPSANAAPINMEVENSIVAKSGQPFQFSINLTDDEKSISNQQIFATITKPKISTNNALKAYAHLLKDIQLPQDLLESTTNNNLEIEKLNVLRKNMMPNTDIQPQIKYGKILTQGKDGKYTGTIEDTLEAGSYNVHLQVTGYAEKSKTPFSRSHFMSILVTD